MSWIKRRLQFSLGSLLLLAVIASLGAALARMTWLMHRQTQELERAMQRQAASTPTTGCTFPPPGLP